METIYASVLLLDGKIAGWNVGVSPKKGVGDYNKVVNMLVTTVSDEDILSDTRDLSTVFKKYSFIEDKCVVVASEYQYSNPEERAFIFNTITPTWFSQWQLMSGYCDLCGNLPYIK